MGDNNNEMDKPKQVASNGIRKTSRVILRTVFRPMLIVVIIIMLAIVLIAGFAKVLKLIETKEDSNKSKNASGAVRNYTESTSISDDGNITLDEDVQTFWDKLEETKNDILGRLDTPEELSKLLNAGMVTKYLDTRPGKGDSGYDEKDWKKNIEADVEWDEINKDVNNRTVQGIIKLKRQDTDGNEKTLTYVSKDKFYDWIEEYNISGTESAKNNILTHFTLEQREVTSGSSSLNFSPNDITTEISEAIVKAANEQGPAGPGYCQKWVRLVYERAGFYSNIGYSSALDAYEHCKISESMDNIPIGATVYGTGTGTDGAKYGHVGIYVGNGMVRDNQAIHGVGKVVESTLEQWLSWQECTYRGRTGWLGWGWQAGAPKTSNIVGDSAVQTVTETSTSDSATKTQVQYYAIVGTISDHTEQFSSNDPNFAETPNSYSIASTKEIFYQNMVSKYVMPFNYLWTMLVYGQDKDFVLDLANLVYNSKFEITIYDNLTVTTNTETIKYKFQQKMDTTVGIAVNKEEFIEQIGEKRKNRVTTYYRSRPDTVETLRTTIKTTVDRVNTVDVALTLANAWCANYTQNYELKPLEQTNKSESGPTSLEDEYINTTTDKGSKPAVEKVILEEAKKVYVGDDYSFFVESTETKSRNSNVERTTQTVTTTENARYISSPEEYEWKDDKRSKEPNFVTILAGNYNARSNILSIESWLFEALEQNDDTKDMVDLTKYFLYKLTGTSYGVTEVDFTTYKQSSFSDIQFGSSGGIGWAYTACFENRSLLEYVNGARNDYNSTFYIYQYVTEDRKYYKMGWDAKSDGSQANGNKNFGLGVCFYSVVDNSFINQKYFAKYGINIEDAKYQTYKTSLLDVEIVDAISQDIYRDNEATIKKLLTEKGINATESQIHAFVDMAYNYGPESQSVKKAMDVFKQVGANESALINSSASAFHEERGRSRAHLISTGEYIDREGKVLDLSRYASSGNVPDGTAGEKLAYIFPNGIPLTQSECEQYMQTIKVPITTKEGNKTTTSVEVHKAVVQDVKDVLQTAQDAGFKVYSVGGYAYRKMNNGSGSQLSHHSYGIALDINVNENYSHRGSTIYAGSFWDPSKSEYSIPKDGVLVKAFKSKGWKWGGEWSGNYQDYMHFSLTGN